MRFSTRFCFLLVAISISVSLLHGADLSGSYVGESEASVSLTVKESPDGQITGTMSEGGKSLPVKGRRKGTGFAGTIGLPGQAQAFTATTEEDRIVLTISGETIVFKKRGTTTTAKSTAAVKNSPHPTAAGLQNSGKGQRNVVINGKRLSDKEIRDTELKYHIRIPDADYWYDRMLGAWGVHGSPTLGFIAPNIDLGGGTLAADASGGGTNIFVNGRALHPLDVLALQQITGPILPGRYFITAQGLAGFEGGPPLWNLAAMVAQAQRGGGSNTWQSRITGASGFSDGTTGAVFLPNGGIVSTGQ